MIVLLSHLVACVAFAALAIVLLADRRPAVSSLVLAGAALATAGWAAAVVFAARFGPPFSGLMSPTETLRTAAWTGFTVALVRPAWTTGAPWQSARVVGAALAVALTVQFGFDIAGWLGWVGRTWPATVSLFLLARLLVAVGGLVLVHNLFMQTMPASRWSIRLLCIGLAALFGYDLNMYTLTFLTGRVSADLFAGRGLIDALVVPLVLISARRNRVWDLSLSRQAAFQTFSLGIIGGYLVLMSLAAWGVRFVGGDWGRLLGIVVPVAMALTAAVVLASGRFRATARVWIAKNFFAYRYDYRQEWLRLIDVVAKSDAHGSLHERVIEAICRAVDSPGGALFEPADDGGFDFSARWNYRTIATARIEAAGLGDYLADKGRIVDLDELRAGTGDYGAVELPAVAVDPKAWLLVPLLHIDRLTGFVLLERSLAERELNWEDFDLLRTAGRQAASYIAEASGQAALSEAQKFDEFNRRFAFIMHDIKNLVSQLSLVARNAERHADNPAFRADMVETLNSSVGKMNGLLARLAQHNTARPDDADDLDLRKLLTAIVADKRVAHANLALERGRKPVIVTADAARLEQVFHHLIQNAIDASEPGSPISVRVEAGPAQIRIDVADSGRGMTAAFVRDELFKPFHSTKPGGFGIGAYEAREIVRGLGGRLDVASRAGEGTVFSVTLANATSAIRAAA